MKLQTDKGGIELPEKPAPAQLRSIVLALIRSEFEDDASGMGELEAIPPDGWKTTYVANGQRFAIEYTPQDGYAKKPIGAAN